MQQTYINNQNQEAFILVIINCKLPGAFLYLLCKILFFKKYRPCELKNISFILPTDDLTFFAVLPVNQKTPEVDLRQLLQIYLLINKWKSIPINVI